MKNKPTRPINIASDMFSGLKNNFLSLFDRANTQRTKDEEYQKLKINTNNPNCFKAQSLTIIYLSFV